MKVVVVMATYNGSPYIAEQIASIKRQTFENWVLLIRDDGSTDGTRELIERAVESDTRISFVQDGLGNLGSVQNFAALLQSAMSIPADYFFLSDQDDVWLPEKLAQEIACVHAAEAKYGKEMPVLVHSDLTVVDVSLGVLNRSFMSYQRIWHCEKNPIKILLAHNFVTGCTVVVNRALLREALPIPAGVLMHDWWLALCAAAFGNIAYVPESTVLYRQHGRNQIGAKGYWRNYFAKIVYRLLNKRHTTWGLGIKPEVHQARLLLERIQNSQSVVSRATLSSVRKYVAILGENVGSVARVALVFASGVRSQTVLRTLYFYRRLVRAEVVIEKPFKSK